MKWFKCAGAIALLEILNDSNLGPAEARLNANMTSTPTIGAAGIPLIGLGTWDLRGRTCVRMVEAALRLGYRHVDTAEM